MKHTIKVADKETLDAVKVTEGNNAEKLDEITNFLESGGGIE